MKKKKISIAALDDLNILVFNNVERKVYQYLTTTCTIPPMVYFVKLIVYLYLGEQPSTLFKKNMLVAFSSGRTKLVYVLF